MEVLVILEQLKLIGITQISEYTLKDFFAQRDYINTTGQEIKEQAKAVGIKLKPCNVVIPEELFPIDKRKYKEAAKTESKVYFANRKLTKEILEELYIKNKLPQSEIAKMYNISATSVHDSLKKFEIPLKENSLSVGSQKIREDIEKIKKMREEGILLKDIAKEYGCVESTLSKILSKNKLAE